MKENLTVSKSFRFKPSTMEKLEKMKGALGNASMNDNLAVNLVIEKFYEQVYAPVQDKEFSKRVQQALNIMEHDKLDQVVKIALEELEVLRLVNGESREESLRAFIEMCVTCSKSYLGDEIAEVCKDLAVYNTILNRMDTRVKEQLQVDEKGSRQLIRRLEDVYNLAFDIKIVGLEQAKLDYGVEQEEV